MDSVLKKEILVDKFACRAFGVVSFIILISLGAFVRIPLPFTPVPLTLQTFFVLLCGAILGAGLGTSSQFAYLFLGAVGLPIFTNAGSGLLYLFGPTGGYLIGFVFAAFFIGKTIRSLGKRTFFSVFLLMCLADLILLSCGMLWLKILLGYNLERIFLIGFLPFIPGEILKIFVATYLFLKMQDRLRKIF